MSETHSFLERAWHRNPFDSDLARAHSAYAGYDGADLTRLLETAAPRPFELVAHAAFRAFVQAPEFSCLGARAALARGTYRFGAYGTLASDAATAGLARDLYAFATERHGFESTFTTFVAVFRDVAGDDDPEVSFESALWKQRKRLLSTVLPAGRSFTMMEGTYSPLIVRFSWQPQKLQGRALNVAAGSQPKSAGSLN